AAGAGGGGVWAGGGPGGGGGKKNRQRARAAGGGGKSPAASSTRPAPVAIMRALSLGQPCRGLTSRNCDRPKFAMARAAAPIFSPSCGSTKTTIGPRPALQSLVLSVPAPGIESPKGSGAAVARNPDRQGDVSGKREHCKCGLSLQSWLQGEIPQ